MAHSREPVMNIWLIAARVQARLFPYDMTAKHITDDWGSG